MHIPTMWLIKSANASVPLKGTYHDCTLCTKKDHKVPVKERRTNFLAKAMKI